MPKAPSATVSYIPTSHLDLFWLGNYKSCLARGVEVIKQYIDRCIESEEETFLVETAVFGEEFLHHYPGYTDELTALVKAGRVEVGAAYIDRKEHLPLGESHIRNLVIGKRWYRDVFGGDNGMATHPDLPSFIPQTPQIYVGAGIRYYVTTRKLFPDGAVWRFKAPDGSAITVLHYPVHYVYLPMDEAEVPASLRSQWAPVLDLGATLKMFPQGVVPVSGSAGDLSDRETFRARYGRYLEELVAEHRQSYKDLEFGYTTPSAVLRDYDGYDGLPELSGEVPSVWGIGIANGSNFYVDQRCVEASLLTAEALAAVAETANVTWRPQSSASWQGVYYERAFFARKDPIEPGHELNELWKMHVFCQDHNAGGEEGTLSEFQKQVRQQRCQGYAEEITTTALSGLASLSMDGAGSVAFFNPHPYSWSEAVTLRLPPATDLSKLRLDVADGSGSTVPWQLDESADDGILVRAIPPAIPPVGYQVCSLEQDTQASRSNPLATIQIDDDGSSVTLDNGKVRLTVSKRTGA